MQVIEQPKPASVFAEISMSDQNTVYHCAVGYLNISGFNTRSITTDSNYLTPQASTGTGIGVKIGNKGWFRVVFTARNGAGAGTGVFHLRNNGSNMCGQLTLDGDNIVMTDCRYIDATSGTKWIQPYCYDGTQLHNVRLTVEFIPD